RGPSAADLPGREPGLRRRPGRRRLPSEPLPRGLSRGPPARGAGGGRGLLLMEPHRLRAPSSDGALLAEPPLTASGALLAANRERLDRWDHDFQGRTASRLRPLVRAQVLDASRRFLADAGFEPPTGPAGAAPGLVVTGHQPELFHPGVWVKHF